MSRTVYRWGPPPDAAAVARSVAQTAQGEVDAVLFTSAPGAAEWLATARRLELRSTAAVLDGHALPLSRASLSLLRALFEARGGVVARAELAASLPRSGGAPSDSAHAVDVAIARTRDALGIPTLIRTVVKRGYRLDVASPEGPA